VVGSRVVGVLVAYGAHTAKASPCVLGQVPGAGGTRYLTRRLGQSSRITPSGR
jgi:hypothetical protein